MQKLNKRKCAECGIEFQKQAPLQNCCSIPCALERSRNLNKKLREKKSKEETKVMKIDTHSKEHKRDLQAEINKLARMIDACFDYYCIDCGKPFGKQTDGAHFHGRGSNNSLRYNLHNIHSAKSDCNQYSDKHKEGYRIGIIKRYGQDYMDLIDALPLNYKEVKLTNLEITEKLKLVRAIIRNFRTYKFITAISGREIFNNLIGIYK